MALWLQSGCEQQYGLGVLPCLRACMNAKHSRVCAIIIFHAELMLYTRLLRNNRGMREHFRKLCVLCCTLYPEFPHTHTHKTHVCSHVCDCIGAQGHKNAQCSRYMRICARCVCSCWTNDERNRVRETKSQRIVVVAKRALRMEWLDFNEIHTSPDPISM